MISNLSTARKPHVQEVYMAIKRGFHTRKRISKHLKKPISTVYAALKELLKERAILEKTQDKERFYHLEGQVVGLTKTEFKRAFPQETMENRVTLTKEAFTLALRRMGINLPMNFEIEAEVLVEREDEEDGTYTVSETLPVKLIYIKYKGKALEI